MTTQVSNPPRRGKAEKPERKPVWRRPAIRIVKIERTEGGHTSHFENEDSYYFPES